MNIKNKLFKEPQIVFYILIVLAILMRLFPHPPNFIPIGAIAIFSGAYKKNKHAWMLPLFILFISDLIIGLYNPFIMFSVYISFIISVFVGSYFLSRKRNVFFILGASVSSATILFTLSNFTVWLTGIHYSMSIDGLITCFIRALPFYGNTLLSNLLYSLILFGIYESFKYFTKQKANLDCV